MKINVNKLQYIKKLEDNWNFLSYDDFATLKEESEESEERVMDIEGCISTIHWNLRQLRRILEKEKEINNE